MIIKLVPFRGSKFIMLSRECFFLNQMHLYNSIRKIDAPIIHQFCMKFSISSKYASFCLLSISCSTSVSNDTD